MKESEEATYNMESVSKFKWQDAVGVLGVLIAVAGMADMPIGIRVFCFIACAVCMSISFFSQKTLDIRLRWVLSVAITIFMFVLSRSAVNKASEPNPIDKLTKQLDGQDEQHKFLEEFPLGFVVFETDAVTGSFTPTGARQGLETYAFNFQTAKILENTPTKITIRLPDVMKMARLLFQAT